MSDISTLAARQRLGEDTEVTEKPSRRTFTAEYKLRILAEVDGSTEQGAVGAILRREGLYSSHLTSWRRQRERGEIAGLRSKKRGPAKRRDHRDHKITELEREVKRLRARAERAEALVALQKKVSEILGVELPDPEGRR